MAGVVVARVALLTSLVGIAAAHGQAEAPRGVTVFPVRVEQDVAARPVAAEIVVANGETSPRRIEMHVAGLGHDLDGVPVFLEGAGAATALRLDAASFVLEPGQRRGVGLTGAIPEGARGLYAAVLTEFSPLVRPAGVVEARSQVASLFLLRGPKPWDQRIQIADVGIRAGDGRAVEVFAAARNVGNVHVRPSGRVRIFSGSRLLATVRLPAENVLPGFARRLVGTWTPPAGFSGRVRLEAEIGDGPARRAETADLTRGRAVARTADVSALRAGVDERGPLVTLTLTNTGTVAIAPIVDLSASEGDAVRDRALLPQEPMRPGEKRRLTWRPALAAGLYLISAQARLRDSLLDQDATGLRVGRPAGNDTGGGGRSSWMPLGLLVAVVGARWALARRRRTQRRAPAPQARPATAEAPPAPLPPGQAPARPGAVGVIRRQEGAPARRPVPVRPPAPSRTGRPVAVRRDETDKR